MINGITPFSSNKEIYDAIKSHFSGTYDYILIGDRDGKMLEPEVWNILKPRLLEFLETEFRVYREYRDYCRSGDWVFTDKTRDWDLKYVNFGPGKRELKTLVAIYKTSDGNHMWVIRNISDFCDPNFEANYSARLRDRELEKVTAKINKIMDKLGELLDEQERLKKKRGNI